MMFCITVAQRLTNVSAFLLEGQLLFRCRNNLIKLHLVLQIKWEMQLAHCSTGLVTVTLYLFCRVWDCLQVPGV